MVQLINDLALGLSLGFELHSIGVKVLIILRDIQMIKFKRHSNFKLYVYSSTIVISKVFKKLKLAVL